MVHDLDGFRAALGLDSGAALPELPAWLAQLLTALYQGQRPEDSAPEDRADWTGRVYADLARLAEVPFAVLHDWHAGTVLPLLAEACDEAFDAAFGKAFDEDGRLAGLHVRASAGEPIAEPDWTSALLPVLGAVYRRAYGYPAAYAANHANATEYGTANGFGEPGTAEYAEYYARLATGANQRASAEANAIAQAHALAAAYAAADPVGYAATYPYATVRGYALAVADAAGGGSDQAIRLAYLRLADGLADCLHQPAG